MTRLLVSVRNAVEARIALDAGVDLIDIKEPNRGALGAADASVWREVLDIVAGRVPVSCALGELSEIRQANIVAIPAGMQYVKIGLSGIASVSNWRAAWREKVSQRSADCNVVAVVYADGERVGAPQAREILEAAQSLPCAAILIDTFEKSSGNVFQHWPSDALETYLGHARDAGLLTVLGGGLDWSSLELALTLPVDYVAVRGLACLSGRVSAVDAAACRRLVSQVRTKTAIPEL